MKQIDLLEKFHNRSGFDCGNEALNRFLQQTARQHNQKGISRTFVLIESDRFFVNRSLFQRSMSPTNF